MLYFIILIICVNFDALSLGISYGLNKIKLNTKTIICISIISTILFATPLLTSKYIYKIFNQNICNLINGFFLILLGIFFLIQKNKQKIKNNHFIETIIISIDAIFTALFNGYFLNNYIFYIFFYCIFNYFAIFLGNKVFYKIQDISNFNLSIFSGIIFIFLGTLKIFGV